MSGKTAHIVLFRGVGGATQLPVKQLREVLTAAGFDKVATYINSGNAVLASPLDTNDVARKVAELVKEHMSFAKNVIVRNRDEWHEMIEENPFPHAVSEPTKLHVAAMEEEASADAIAALEAKATGTERFVVRNRTLYLHTPDGMGKSKFAPKIEPTLKVAMTARNWRTMLALRDMVDGL